MSSMHMQTKTPTKRLGSWGQRQSIFDHWKMKFEEQHDATVPQKFVKDLVCISLLLLILISHTVSYNTLGFNRFFEGFKHI